MELLLLSPNFIKLTLNYSFCSPRNGIFNQPTGSHLVGTGRSSA